MSNSPLKKSLLIERPPVVAVMGHIDHGKSQLLDYIRQTKVVDREAGGITQHTSAYEVILPRSTSVAKGARPETKKITFLDTPGHAAFTAMRVRGAQIADLAILLVSAEEGVKTQTLEALNSIQEQKTPFVVAINKIDKPSANVETTKQSLAENGVFVEGYGGNIPCASISAKDGTGVEELLDLLLLVAELEELTGDPSLPAQGLVLESHLDAKRGHTATLIIKNGSLRVGDWLVIDRTVTKIKQLNNFLGQPVKELTFSAPAEIFGFAGAPAVGAGFRATSNKKEAEKWAEENQEKTCAKFPRRPKIAGVVSLPIIIKADVAGTLEAVEKELAPFNEQDQVSLEIVDCGVGAITENDVRTISAFPHAKILGFRVKTEKGALALAEKNGVVIKTSDIIYQLSEWLDAEMKALAPQPAMVEEVIGRAKVLKVFGRTKDKQIVGCALVSGRIPVGQNCKIIRRDSEIGRGELSSLQLQKMKVSEITGQEQFGAEVEARNEIVPGDYLEVFLGQTK